MTIGSWLSPAYAAPFTPPSLTGIVLWLDSTKGISLNGSNVSVWTDLSGNGNSATQGTPASQPAYSGSGWSNGKGAISTVVGSGRQLITPSVSLGAFSIAVVGNFSVVGYPVVHNTDAMPGFFMFGSTGPSLSVGRAGTNDSADYTTNWFRDSANKSAIVTYNGTDATLLLYVNGVQVSLSSQGNNPGISAQSGNLFIPGNQSAAAIPTGLLAEIDVYNRALSQTEVAALYGYHKAQWATP